MIRWKKTPTNLVIFPIDISVELYYNIDMNIKNIENKIISLGGTFNTTEVLRQTGETFKHLVGQLGKYQIEFSENASGFFTALKDGTKYDMGSDYNPGGYEFYEKIKDLERLI